MRKATPCMGVLPTQKGAPYATSDAVLIRSTFQAYLAATGNSHRGLLLEMNDWSSMTEKGSPYRLGMGGSICGCPIFRPIFRYHLKLLRGNKC